ncbi:hypothetical protein BDD43_5806 [Mucilaginibacter gracilis]|uniref:Uncharacterized protein n=1 Tax=Mucilaginibacter gracilis TaxID=423350 RepID=A0A495J950_9SPHI|nr:hypothetical protein [Mucilaginibacter gracilis]RKR85535.1 hypothetical protein BDD43_5806 [Mucilaginibacter gracilis]
MDPAELLENFIKLFEDYKDNLKVLNYLIEHDMIHPSFEKRYILNNDDFPFTISDMIRKNDNVVEFYLEAASGCPYKGEVIFDGRWCLKSFRFQCQGCFGDDSLCNVCGSSGWGVL